MATPQHNEQKKALKALKNTCWNSCWFIFCCIQFFFSSAGFNINSLSPVFPQIKVLYVAQRHLHIKCWICHNMCQTNLKGRSQTRHVSVCLMSREKKNQTHTFISLQVMFLQCNTFIKVILFWVKCQRKIHQSTVRVAYLGSMTDSK